VPENGPGGLAESAPLHAQLLSAVVQGRVALGEQAGTRIGRLGAARSAAARAARGLRQAHLDGFDLHANVRCPPTTERGWSISAATCSGPRWSRIACGSWRMGGWRSG
jgi:hypothetical protein